MTDVVPFASLEEALKEKKISQKTYERVKIAKTYIEKKYKMKREEEEEKRKDWDLIMTKIDELQVSPEEADEIKKAILHKEGENLRIKRQKMTIRDFESLSIIGKGAFGEVRVCKYTLTGEVLAIKKMRKDEMHKKNQVLHVRAERDVLSEAKNPWIVDLKYSFQDDVYLYLVMEFLPGGDLMSLLMTKDILTEEETRFYAAEMVLAIESVHKLKCIHRDLKPDNVLIDIDGHIKLSDFGLSKKVDSNLYENEYINGNMDSNLNGLILKNVKDINLLSKNRKRRIYAFSTVGTPDYIAPEVFSQKGYGPEVDWWSLGVILFEMLIGYPPFFSDSATDTCKKILNWKTNLVIPPETKISKEAIDLIKRLITDVDKRLGYNGADEVKKHPFFRGMNWNNLNSIKPPFVPDVNSEWDTKYFDHFDEDEPFYPPDIQCKKVNKDVSFVNFTYKREMDNQKSSMINALEVLDSLKDSLRRADRETKFNYIENGGTSIANLNNDIIKNKNNSRSSLSGIIDKEDDYILNTATATTKEKTYILNNANYNINITPGVKNNIQKSNSLSINKNIKEKDNFGNIGTILNNNFNHTSLLSPKNKIDNSNNSNFNGNSNLKNKFNDIEFNNNNMNKAQVNSSSKDSIVKQNSMITISKKSNQNLNLANTNNTNNISDNYFSNKSNSTNLQNGNNNMGGSDFLLKSNHELEKKLKLKQTKQSSILSVLSPSSMNNTKSQFEKINKVNSINNKETSGQINNYNSETNNNKILTKKSAQIKIETGENYSHINEEYLTKTNTGGINIISSIAGNSKKTNEKVEKIKFNYISNETGLKKEYNLIKGVNNLITEKLSNTGLNYQINSNLMQNKQANSLITTNYLKDFIHSENLINTNKGRESLPNQINSTNTNKNSSHFKYPNSQIKMNPNKEVNKIWNDPNKPLSTKSSTSKKIVYNSGVNMTSNVSNPFGNSNIGINPNKFVKMRDSNAPTNSSLQSQRVSSTALNEKFPKLKK